VAVVLIGSVDREIRDYTLQQIFVPGGIVSDSLTLHLMKIVIHDICTPVSLPRLCASGL
jgi:hypothetical protein